MSVLVVNLYGAPGSGKSTGAAYIFSKLKAKGINAELVTEAAKDKVWEDNDTALRNQAYIFGEQFYRMTRCEDKVDVIVTDSPLLLSLIYNHTDRLTDAFDRMVIDVAQSYDSLDVYISRAKAYSAVGRRESEVESALIESRIINMLEYCSRDGWHPISGTEAGYDKVVDWVLRVLNRTSGTDVVLE